MKKILIFSLSYYPKFVGGAEVALKEITDRISNDYEFHMITLRFDSSLKEVEKVGNIIVHRIGFTNNNVSVADLKKFPLSLNKIFFQFYAFIRAWRLHRIYKFELVWAMMAHSCGVPAALFKIFFPEVKYLLTLQEGDTPQYIKKKMLPIYPLFKKAFTKADFIQTISTFLASWAKDMGAECEIKVVPNGVDLKKFSQEFSDEELKIAKQKLGKKAGEVFLITTSRLVHKNGIDSVIEALPSLQSNIHFAILGIGPDENKLKMLTNNLGLNNRVHFMGYVSHDEMPKYLKLSDIFIRPSRSEGMGNSFVEAMASNIPVIATQEGGLSDFIFDNIRNKDKVPTAFAVDKDSPTQIAKAVNKIVSDKGLVSSVVVNASQMVLEKYEWTNVAKQMKESVFDKVL